MRTSIRLLAATALLLAPAAAPAATYLITFTGTVASGYDQTGVFLAPKSLFAGQAFTANYWLTYPAPGADETVSNGHAVSGGTLHGSVSPIHAALTINGVTKTIDGAYYGAYELANDAGGLDLVEALVDDRHSLGAVDFNYSVGNTIGSTLHNIIDTTDFAAPIDYAALSGDIVSAYFSFSAYDHQRGNVETAQGYLAAQHVTVARLPDALAVPEPASWAMLLSGFAVVGRAMRRRGARFHPAFA